MLLATLLCGEKRDWIFANVNAFLLMTLYCLKKRKAAVFLLPMTFLRFLLVISHMRKRPTLTSANEL